MQSTISKNIVNNYKEFVKNKYSTAILLPYMMID